MIELFANSGDPDQTPRPDLGLLVCQISFKGSPDCNTMGYNAKVKATGQFCSANTR